LSGRTSKALSAARLLNENLPWASVLA